MVSGAVNPDHFVVDTAHRTGPRAAARRQAGRRSAPLPGGGTERVDGAPGAGPPACLTDAQVRALAALGDRVEAHYGAPQDIEWAIDARGRAVADPGPAHHHPLPAAGQRAAPGADLRVYFCFSLAQGLNRPITPMGLAAFRLLASSVARLLGHPRRRPAGRAAGCTPRPASGSSST